MIFFHSPPGIGNHGIPLEFFNNIPGLCKSGKKFVPARIESGVSVQDFLQPVDCLAILASGCVSTRDLKLYPKFVVSGEQ